MHRRRLLAVGLVSAAALALGGGALSLLQPGWRDARLTASGREIFTALGRGFLDGSLPTEEPARRRALDGLLVRVEALVGGLPPQAQSELAQLLAIMGTAGGRRLLAPLDAPWANASVLDVQRALGRMRVSGVALRRQAYQALHGIVGSAYFSDPSTWDVLGYPGPLEP